MSLTAASHSHATLLVISGQGPAYPTLAAAAHTRHFYIPQASTGLRSMMNSSCDVHGDVDGTKTTVGRSVDVKERPTWSNSSANIQFAIFPDWQVTDHVAYLAFDTSVRLCYNLHAL